MPTRYRTMGEIEQPVNKYEEIAFNGNVITSLNLTPLSSRRGELKTMTDVITPRWRRKSSRGDIVNNPMTMSHDIVHSNPPGHSARRNSGSGNTIQYFQGDGWYIDIGFGERAQVDVSALRAEAGTEAAAGVDAPVVEGLVEAAEWHKTMDLLKVRSDFLSRKLQYILKRKRFRRAVGVISDNWLKYRYGIMPVVRTMDSLLQDWNGRIITTRRTSRGKASASASLDNTISDNSGFFWSITANNHNELDVVVRAGILYEQYAKANRYGFSPSDLPAAAWELVPYSFVVDWFVNAGDFIRAWTPKVGVRTLATWTTVTYDQRLSQQRTATWKSPSGYTNVQSPSGSRTWQTVTTQRTPGISKALVFKESSVSPILTSKRVLDSFALAFNLIKR